MQRTLEASQRSLDPCDVRHGQPPRTRALMGASLIHWACIESAVETQCSRCIMPVLQRVSVSVKNILLASDFSSASDAAASYAKGLALNFRSNVEIAHVFDPSVVTTYMEAVLGLPVKERQHISNESLRRLEREFVAAGIEALTSLPEGHRPYGALLKLAGGHATD